MKVKIYAIACIAALAAMLSGCGNSDNSAGEIKITSTSQTTAGTTSVTTAVTTSASSTTTTAKTTAQTTAKTTTAKTTTAKKTTTQKTTTKATTKRTAKATTTMTAAQQEQQYVYQDPAPVYYNDPKPTYVEPEPVVTTTTQTPVATTTTTTTKAAEITPKPDNTSSGTNYANEIPPGWNSAWTYDPPNGKEYSKASVMKEFGISSETYDAYEALIRGTSTKAQRLLVRDDVIKYTIEKYNGKLDEKGYCFETADGQPTCDTTKASAYGPCEFGEHAETSFFTAYWVGGFNTLAECTRRMIQDSRSGADHNIRDGSLFNVQVVYYGLDSNVGTIIECSVIVFSCNSEIQTNQFFKPMYAKEQTWDDNAV